MGPYTYIIFTQPALYLFVNFLKELHNLLYQKPCLINLSVSSLCLSMHLLPPYDTFLFNLSLSLSISSSLPSAPSPKLAAPELIQLPKLLEEGRRELQPDTREVQQKDDLSRVRTESSQLRWRLDTTHTELRQKNYINEAKDNNYDQTERPQYKKKMASFNRILQHCRSGKQYCGREMQLCKRKMPGCVHSVRRWSCYMLSSTLKHPLKE